jgi:cell wall-associated NlpC family hydrolase
MNLFSGYAAAGSAGSSIPTKKFYIERNHPMELKDISDAIESFAKQYPDPRVSLFRVEAEALKGNTLRLRGQVLEEANMRVLEDNLQARFPGLRIDESAVEIGRKTPPRILAVGTNLTSLHNGTSFLAEMATQMLNGAQVEILFEPSGRWGFARLVDGYLGWTYIPYLTEKPLPQPFTHLVGEPVALLRRLPHHDAPILTRLYAGTALKAVQVQGDWVWVELAGGWSGWLPVGEIRSLERLPQTAEERRETLVADAYRLVGVPYLWGGNSANGIDCSGFAQLLHRLVGVTLPRDADMQFSAGKAVEPPFEVGDLLFFGETGEQRKITHVGVSLGGWKMIHSSRRQNGVQVDDVQQVESLKEIYLCAATYIN